MTTPLVECIPNFSEARRPEIIEAIVSHIRATSDVSVLNVSSDIDHNRTVVTFIGPPLAVEEAAFRGIQEAARLIDLDQHTGSHPRIGAADVVPFVPISGVEMTECVQMAKRLGERVGTELKIPVYLYEQAATRPDRVNLEEIRRGQYETLKAEIETHPERQPDFGPNKVGRAGAVVIGARHPLIAFNVYLTTEDVSIAKSIAKGIRQSSGGYRFVKGLGMLVENRAQVSMNLTNFRQTPIHRVVETIRSEAARHGVAIHHSELVGLIPGEALMESAAWYLQLQDFDLQQVLENRLSTAQSDVSSASGFLHSLAAGTPTPGGGSAAAFAGAMAAALVAMVARLTIGKKKYHEVENQMAEILVQTERLRQDLTTGVEKDAAAFEAILAAVRLPKESQEQVEARDQAIAEATLNAAKIPMETAEQSVQVIELAERCVVLGNLNAISDAASAAALGKAALTSAGYNVRINASQLNEKQNAEMLLIRLEALESKALKLEKAVHKAIHARGGLST